MKRGDGKEAGMSPGRRDRVWVKGMTEVSRGQVFGKSSVCLQNLLKSSGQGKRTRSQGWSLSRQWMAAPHLGGAAWRRGGPRTGRSLV